jgi:hypothetical protein
MSYQAKVSLTTLQNNADYPNDKGNYECVALIQKVTNAPNTSQWKKGKKVMDAKKGDITAGTVIATFDDEGKYPLSANRHAAIYVDHDEGGIGVYDQWNAQKMSKWRKIRNKKLVYRDVNDAHWYWVVD